MSEATAGHGNHNFQRFVPPNEHAIGEFAVGMVVPTTGRFSLARPGYDPSEARDVMASGEAKAKLGYRRFLAIDPGITDDQVYQALEANGVPQLPKVDLAEGSATTKVLFGIREGLKPLINEGLFLRPSSDTYVSDVEIFTQMGVLYRDAWEATGKLLLDPKDPADSPMRHVAIHSFDDADQLLLCPPYSPGEEMRMDRETAEHRFTVAVGNELQGRLGMHASAEQSDHLDELLAAAKRGFQED